MFGWYAHHMHDSERLPVYGVRLEHYETATWLTIWFGKRKWMWRRLRALRETGPSENRSVLGWFFRGPERRRRSNAAHKAFMERAARPPLPAAEIRRRNREAIEKGIVRPLPPAFSGLDMHNPRDNK